MADSDDQSDHDDGKRLWSRVRQSAVALNSERFHVALEQNLTADDTPLRATSTNNSAAARRSLRPLRQQLGGKQLGPNLDHITSPPSAQITPYKQHGDTTGLDRATAERIKRGKMEIQGRLDLHGMTRERAHKALQDFLLRGHRQGKRLVLVVTGKGNGATGGGVLRREVPMWLNQSPLRELIVTYNHARPEQGGTGALTILLKRIRTTTP